MPHPCSAPTEPLTFGQENFAHARLGNRRRTQRLVQLADHLLAHPRGSLPEKLPHFKDRKALYRLMAQPKTTHAAVLAPHAQLTARRIAAHAGQTVLLIHDGTDLDYTGLASLHDELGQLGAGKAFGLHCHNSLAAGAQTGAVLGLAHQILHRRPHVSKGESRQAKRQRADRESRLWYQACAAIGPAPAGVRVIDVCDRDADTFEFLDFAHRQGRSYVVRAAKDRVARVEDAQALEELEVQGPVPTRLFDYARGLPAWGQQVLALPARGDQPARTAVVRVAASPLTVLPPARPRGEHRAEALATWVVCAREVDAPAGVEPLEWVLLTNVAVETLDELLERLRWYGLRWLVEEYHKCQKTGCGIEALQLGKHNHAVESPWRDNQRLQPAIALLSVVAVELLRLRALSRQEATAGRPAAEQFDPLEVEVISRWRYGRVRSLTVRQFCAVVAELGGHAGRKGDGAPGWLTLWRGWAKLQLLVEGARLARGPAGDVEAGGPGVADMDTG